MSYECVYIYIKKRIQRTFKYYYMKFLKLYINSLTNSFIVLLNFVVATLFQLCLHFTMYTLLLYEKI